MSRPDTTLYPQTTRWGPDRPPPRIIRDQPLETAMPDDIAIATAAAEEVIKADIHKFVPPIFQGRIPPGTEHKLASEVAAAVVAALAKAHAKP